MANSHTKTQPWHRTGLFAFNSRVVDSEVIHKRAAGPLLQPKEHTERG